VVGRRSDLSVGSTVHGTTGTPAFPGSPRTVSEAPPWRLASACRRPDRVLPIRRVGHHSTQGLFSTGIALSPQDPHPLLANCRQLRVRGRRVRSGETRAMQVWFNSGLIHTPLLLVPTTNDFNERPASGRPSPASRCSGTPKGQALRRSVLSLLGMRLNWRLRRASVERSSGRAFRKPRRTSRDSSR
jgi:hypothetical protein